MSCARCEQLEEEVAFLKSELGQGTADGDLQALRMAMRHVAGRNRIGRSSPAAVVLTLYRAHGRILSKHQLMEALPPRAGGDDDRIPKIVDVWVCRARIGIGRDSIENVWGRGYRLTPVGMARVAEILQPAQVAA